MMETLWTPSATLPALKARAQLLAQIRAFLAERQIMEVDTQLLSQGVATCPHIKALQTQASLTEARRYYLQTSPEFAMKRLLAAGSGSIYQMAKVFRDDELGPRHNPEFTMLEWYRLGFDEHDLMTEVDALLHAVLGVKGRRLTYLELFEHHLKINPFRLNAQDLRHYAASRGIEVQGTLDWDAWTGLLLSHLIEPDLGQDMPVFVYDFPASQAALARIEGAVAKRFELYYRGMELANGYFELTDRVEQQTRFDQDIAYRVAHQLEPVAGDERLLAALEAGMPSCAGVALGVDRLLMIKFGARHIKEVLPFDWTRA